MENEIFYSPKDVFYQRANAVAEAQKANEPIFTQEDSGAFLVLDEYRESSLTEYGIIYKDNSSVPVPSDENSEAKSAQRFCATLSDNAAYNMLAVANSDQIYMLLATSSPDRLGDVNMQRVILTRLLEMQTNAVRGSFVTNEDPVDVLRENNEEINTISSFLLTMRDAVKVEGNYFAAGYTPAKEP